MQKEYYVGKVGIWLVNLRKRVKKHFSNIVLENVDLAFIVLPH